MDSPAAWASFISRLWSAGVILNATGLLRLSFAFFRGRPIFFFLFTIQALCFLYMKKSRTKLRNSSLCLLGFLSGLLQTLAQMFPQSPNRPDWLTKQPYAWGQLSALDSPLDAHFVPIENLRKALLRYDRFRGQFSKLSYCTQACVFLLIHFRSFS